MKYSISLIFFISLRSLTFGQSEIETLKYQLLIPSISQKVKHATDPELKGLVAAQLVEFYSRYGQGKFEYNHYVYPAAYYGLQSLIRQKTINENRFLGYELGYFIADSSFNQYHGHKPVYGSDKRVAVRSVDFARKQNKLYSAGGDGRVIAWDVEDRSFEEIYQSSRINRVIDFSNDERWMAVATDANEVDLFDLESTDMKPKRIRSHRGSIYDLAFLPDNSAFISVGADQNILRTTLANFDVREVAVVTSKVQTIAITPDANTLAVGSIGGDVYLYDLNVPASGQNEKRVFRRDQDRLAVTDLSFSNSGRYLAISGYNVENGFGYITLWDIQEKSPYGPTLFGFSARVNETEFSPDDKLLAAASHDGSVRIWSAGDIFDLPIVLDDHQDWVWDVAFHPSGDFVMTASADGIIRKFPLDAEEFGGQMCDYLGRNLSDIEWRTYFGALDQIPWEETCPGNPKPVIK